MTVGADLDNEFIQLKARVAALESAPVTVPVPVPIPNPSPSGSFPDIGTALDYSLTHGPVDLGWAAFSGPVVHTRPTGHQKPWGIRNAFIRAPAGHTGPLLTIRNGTGNTSSLKLDNLQLEGGGLLIENVSGNVYQIVLDTIRIRDCKGHAFHFKGGFEIKAYSPFVEVATGDGMRFESTGQGGGLVSSVDVYGPNIRFCEVGIHMVSPTRDVAVVGGYIGHNRRAGARLTNGMARPWVNVGFESNCRDGGTGEVEAGNNVRLVGCSFYMAQSKAPVAVALNPRLNASLIMMCARSGGGTAGQSGLLPSELIGNSGF